MLQRKSMPEKIVQSQDYSSKLYLKPQGFFRNWYFQAVSQLEMRFRYVSLTGNSNGTLE